MPATSYSVLIQQVLGLISRAFSSMGYMLEFLFVGFIRISPLPDEVDFLLVCLFVIGFISFIARLFRGKQ
jgi:hypothetical protein